MSHALTIQLPESLYQHLQTVSTINQQSLEQLVYQSVQGNLPPLMPQVGQDMQAEFLKMQTLSISELNEVAQAQVEEETQKRHLDLLDRNSQEGLADDEQRELADLRHRADRFTLRKAYAWALLRWRGYPIPKLAELPLS